MGILLGTETFHYYSLSSVFVWHWVIWNNSTSYDARMAAMNHPQSVKAAKRAADELTLQPLQ